MKTRLINSLPVIIISMIFAACNPAPPTLDAPYKPDDKKDTTTELPGNSGNSDSTDGTDSGDKPVVTPPVNKTIDPDALPQAIELYNRLAALSLSGQGLLFGHQYDNVNSKSGSKDFDQVMGISDTYKAVGDYPALFGFNFDSGIDKIYKAVVNAAKMGGVITIHNPMNQYKDVVDASLKAGSYATDRVKFMLDETSVQHKMLTNRLDSIALFADSAKIDGKQIPIIFRPWHENTGGSQWWGTKTSGGPGCSDDEYVALWQFTVHYLRDVKHVHSLLYAYAPSRPSEHASQDLDEGDGGGSGYGFRNPGWEWFDIAGFDCYVKLPYNKGSFTEIYLASAQATVDYARAHDKIPASTEFGYKGGLQGNSKDGTPPAPANWFTQEFLGPLKADPYASQLVYALTWTNTTGGWWVPTPPGDVWLSDFVAFFNDPHMMFLQKWKNYK